MLRPEEVVQQPVRQSPSREPNNGASREEAAAAARPSSTRRATCGYAGEAPRLKNALEFELPRATTAKLTKRFLGPKEAKDQELQAALARASGLFAMTVTYAATDVCLENKRQTIGPQDVLTALDALGFEQDDLDALAQFLERDKERRPKHTAHPDQRKYRGVYQGSINAWYSQISIGGQPIHLGSYAAPADAAKAYDRAIWSKLGVEAAALLNFPELIPESLPYVAEAKQRQMEQEAEKARQRFTRFGGGRRDDVPGAAAREGGEEASEEAGRRREAGGRGGPGFRRQCLCDVFRSLPLYLRRREPEAVDLAAARATWKHTVSTRRAVIRGQTRPPFPHASAGRGRAPSRSETIVPDSLARAEERHADIFKSRQDREDLGGGAAAAGLGLVGEGE